MSHLSKLIRLYGLVEVLSRIVRVLGYIGDAFKVAPSAGSDSGRDSLTHGVENEKPEAETQYDLFDESDSYESLRRGRSTLRDERHSPESFD